MPSVVFAQRQNHLTTHFSEWISVVKWYMTVVTSRFVNGVHVGSGQDGSQIPNGGVPFPLLRKGEPGRGTGFRESQEFCLYILQDFWDIQLEMSSRHLDIWVWRSKEWTGDTHLRVELSALRYWVSNSVYESAGTIPRESSSVAVSYLGFLLRVTETNLSWFKQKRSSFKGNIQRFAEFLGSWRLG